MSGAVIFFMVCAFFYLLNEFHMSMRDKMDESVIESINLLASSLAQGHSLESAISILAKNHSMPSSRLYRKILHNMNSGHSFEESIKLVSKKYNSNVFFYIADVFILAKDNSKDIVNSLKELSKRMRKIQTLERHLDSKMSFPVIVLQMTGIGLMPIFYIFLAGVLSDNIVEIVVPLSLKIYLLLITFLMAMLPYLIFGRLKRSLYILPMATTYYVLAFTLVGPKLLSLF